MAGEVICMRFEELLDGLAAGIAEAGFRALLVGGWALSIHGVNRQTIDVDLVIAEDDLPQAEALMARLGYRQAFRNPLFAKFRASGGPGPDVDLLFLTRDTMDVMLAESVAADFGDARFRVPSLRHLLGMKLHALKHGRTVRGVKDLADVEALVRGNDVDVDSADFRELCLRYATADILEEIRSHARG